MLVHYGKQNFKAQLAKIDNNEEIIITLQAKVTENHKEMIANQKKFKPVLEGTEKKKRFKSLNGLKCDVYQDVMVNNYFTPSPVYCHLRVTIIYDDDWCWYLAWRKLGVLIVDCLPLVDLDSV